MAGSLNMLMQPMESCVAGKTNINFVGTDRVDSINNLLKIHGAQTVKLFINSHQTGPGETRALVVKRRNENIDRSPTDAGWDDDL